MGAFDDLALPTNRTVLRPLDRAKQPLATIGVLGIKGAEATRANRT